MGKEIQNMFCFQCEQTAGCEHGFGQRQHNPEENPEIVRAVDAVKPRRWQICRMS